MFNEAKSELPSFKNDRLEKILAIRKATKPNGKQNMCIPSRPCLTAVLNNEWTMGWQWRESDRTIEVQQDNTPSTHYLTLPHLAKCTLTQSTTPISGVVPCPQYRSHYRKTDYAV